MTTTREICTRALRRIRVIGADDDPAAPDSALALAVLNDMMHAWAYSGIGIEHDDLALGDTFFFFVPPAGVSGTVIAALDYQGTWNASTNSPTLTSASGTKGYWYRVSTAGSTTLDDVTTWSVDEAAVFDGAEWLKSQSSRRYEAAVIALLAERLAGDFGIGVDQILARDARGGWDAILAAFVVPPAAQFDGGIVRTPGRRYFEGTDTDA